MTALPPVAPEASQVLPRLRGDLEISLAGDSGKQLPAVVVTDNLRGSYFKLAWPESAVLLMWQDTPTVSLMCAELSRIYGITAGPEEIARVVRFAQENELTETDASGSWRRLSALRQARQQSLLGRLAHGYLFFRIPLLRPEPLLGLLLPRLGFAFSRSFWICVLMAAVLGAYLSLRQWSALVAAAGSSLDAAAVPMYGLVVLGLKALHELGHALTAFRYGCRVPSMGVAIMVGAPVLYTDTSDSWRLSQRHQRLAIVMAGVAAEAVVAAGALLLWPFLPDGFLRQMCFALATVSIVLSLTINLNPFMRFDGYFALSDYTGLPNLQPRAFALGVWKLREWLFDLGHAAPETVSPRLERGMVAYAIATALYRLLLYLAIAAIVYAVAGKAIGILLCAFEIGFFIAKPAVEEAMTWWKLRAEIVARARVRWTGAVAATLAAILLVPWLSTAGTPAVMAAKREEAIYLPFAARLATIGMTDGQRVRRGDILLTANSDDLVRREERALLELRALEFRARRLHANHKERELRAVVASELARTREKIATLRSQKALLVIRAPFDGRIADVDPALATGVWLDERSPLGRLVSEDGSLVRGVVSEADVERVRTGARAVFVPDDAALPSHEIRVVSISPASDGRFSEPILADLHGGRVGSTGEAQDLRARHGMFEVTFSALDHPSGQVVRGMTLVEAEPVSPAQLMLRAIQRVLVREQGF